MKIRSAGFGGLWVVLAVPLLMASECGAGDLIDDPENEGCRTGDVCTIHINYKNFSSTPVHLWRDNQTIGPANRLATNETRVETFEILEGEPRVFQFFAGREGERIAGPVSITLTPRGGPGEDPTILVDWNADETLTARIR